MHSRTAHTTTLTRNSNTDVYTNKNLFYFTVGGASVDVQFRFNRRTDRSSFFPDGEIEQTEICVRFRCLYRINLIVTLLIRIIRFVLRDKTSQNTEIYHRNRYIRQSRALSYDCHTRTLTKNHIKTWEKLTKMI